MPAKLASMRNWPAAISKNWPKKSGNPITPSCGCSRSGAVSGCTDPQQNPGSAVPDVIALHLGYGLGTATNSGSLRRYKNTSKGRLVTMGGGFCQNELILEFPMKSMPSGFCAQDPWQLGSRIEPPGPAGACHRAGQGPDPLRPGAATTFAPLTFVTVNRLERQRLSASFASMRSQIIAAMSGPPRRLMARMPVGEVTLISVR